MPFSSLAPSPGGPTPCRPFGTPRLAKSPDPLSPPLPFLSSVARQPDCRKLRGALLGRGGGGSWAGRKMESSLAPLRCLSSSLRYCLQEFHPSSSPPRGDLLQLQPRSLWSFGPPQSTSPLLRLPLSPPPPPQNALYSPPHLTYIRSSVHTRCAFIMCSTHTRRSSHGDLATHTKWAPFKPHIFTFATPLYTINLTVPKSCTGGACASTVPSV